MSAFEANILYWIQQNIRTPFLDSVSSFLGLIGEVGAIWIVVTVILLLRKKTRKLGVYCAISMLLTLVAVNVIIKPLAARVRPYDQFEFLKTVGKIPHDFSFPSGHTSNGLACAWVLFRKNRRGIGIPALILSILIGLSRLYCAIHYPSDVIVGAIIGIIAAEVAVRAFKKPVNKLFKRAQKKRKAKAAR